MISRRKIIKLANPIKTNTLATLVISHPETIDDFERPFERPVEFRKSSDNIEHPLKFQKSFEKQSGNLKVSEIQHVEYVGKDGRQQIRKIRLEKP